MSDSTSTYVPKEGDRLLVITGKLAANVVRDVVETVNQSLSVTVDVDVLGITVAALMHVDWLKKKLGEEVRSYDYVLLPGLCQGNIDELTEQFGVPFSLGPKEITDLPEFLGGKGTAPPSLDQYDIEILAEINHAPHLSEYEIMSMATRFRQNGADIIDIGCLPGQTWQSIGSAIRQLVADGFRVSVDSFDRQEVEQAISAGAELVLSCNSTNVDWLAIAGVEVVAIPDTPDDLASLWRTIEQLEATGCAYRIDPILEPIGFGFAASLARYYEVRKQAPSAPIMMGIGNLTEMTAVDSAGINVMLAAICQELNIQSVLTTEVISWCQTAVKEFDIARRMMKHAIDQRTLPKRLTTELVMLRDRRIAELGEDALAELANDIRDANYRIFVERGELHVMNRDGYWRGTDPYELFDAFSDQNTALDNSHAFYLGYELAKATTALTLGKQYRQDQALDWGFLTVPEQSAHERRRQQRREKAK